MSRSRLEHLEGEGQQGVPGQNRHRFAEHFVARGPAAPEIVVVQRGQIVVDQRISVDQLQRGGRVLHAFG